MRDDSVSVFVDSIVSLNSWIARVARKMSIDIRDQSILPDVKKAISALNPGNTQIVLNLYSNGKSASLVLKNMVELGPTTAKDLTGLGTKVVIE